MSKLDRNETANELKARRAASLDRAAQRLAERREHPELYPDDPEELGENYDMFTGETK